MLKNPTTSTPVGVWCIAMVCTFAGQRGFLGEMIVLVTVYFHVVLALWFLYMCFFQFRLWAEPGWFPCIVGISYAGIKTWIYFPVAGLLLVAVREILLCILFVLFVSLASTHSNRPSLPALYNILFRNLLYQCCPRVPKSQDFSSGLLDSAQRAIHHLVCIDIDIATNTTRGGTV